MRLAAQSPSSTQTPSSGQSTSSAQASSGTGHSSASASELSGTVKKVDKAKRSVSISTPMGGEQELKISQSATITRDGSTAGLEQLKEGEQVRASFDPASKEATKLEIQSKSDTGEKSKSSTETKSGENKSGSESKKY